MMPTDPSNQPAKMPRGKKWWTKGSVPEPAPAMGLPPSPAMSQHRQPAAGEPVEKAPEIGATTEQIKQDRKAARKQIRWAIYVCAVVIFAGLVGSAAIDFFLRQPKFSPIPYKLEIYARNPNPSIRAWIEWTSLPKDQRPPELIIEKIDSRPAHIVLGAAPVAIALAGVNNTLWLKVEGSGYLRSGSFGGELHLAARSTMGERSQRYPIKIEITSLWEFWRTFWINLIGVSVVAVSIYALVLWMNPCPFGWLILYEPGEIRSAGGSDKSWHGAASRQLRISRSCPIRKQLLSRVLPSGRNRILLSDLDPQAPNFELTFYRWMPLLIGRKQFRVSLNLSAERGFLRGQRTPQTPIAGSLPGFAPASSIIYLRGDSEPQVFLLRKDDTHFECLEFGFGADARH